MTNIDNKNIKQIDNLLGLEKSQYWMMAPNERLAIIGIINIIKPISVLELGYASGGCTEYLSKYSKNVYTVDIDKKVLEVSGTFKNVIPFNMTTDEAYKLFKKDKIHFNFCIVDADHSTEGACRDLGFAIELSDIIIMHDTSNPECRKGYQLALKKKDIYFDLDFMEGHYQVDGLWGGLGIVINYRKRMTPYLTKKTSNYPYMKRKFSLMFFSRKIKLIYRLYNYYINRIKQKVTSSSHHL